jgi:hypothetical protein
MYERGSPMFGAQATSRTQSAWPSSTSSSTQACVSSENPQILTILSHPALAKRFTGDGRRPPALGVSSEPARAAGAHDTALHPIACASNTSAPHWPSSRCVRLCIFLGGETEEDGTFETENGDLAVRGSTGEYCAEFVRSPRHRID